MPLSGLRKLLNISVEFIVHDNNFYSALFVSFFPLDRFRPILYWLNGLKFVFRRAKKFHCECVFLSEDERDFLTFY